MNVIRAPGLKDVLEFVSAPALSPVGLFFALDQCACGTITPVVAGSVRGVVDALHSPPELGQSFMRDSLMRIAAPDSTSFVGVHRIPPGYRFSWTEDRSLPPATRPAAGVQAARRRPTDPVGEFRLLIERALREALTRPISLLMSGGLDSTYLGALLARAADTSAADPVVAYVHRPHPDGTPSPLSGHVADEWPLACAVEAQYRGRLHVVPIVVDSTADVFDECLQVASASLSPVNNPANSLWSREAARLAHDRGSGQMVIGDFGNFSFSGYHGYVVPELLNRHRYRDLATLASSRPNLPQDVWNSVRSRLLHLRRHSAGVPAPVPNSFTSFTLKDAPPVQVPPELEGRAEWLRTMRTEGSPLLAALAPEAFWGVEFVDPFAAEEVLRWAVELDPIVWRSGPGTRSFARRALEGLVPDSVRLNEDRGFQSSDIWWRMRDQRRRLLDEADLLPSSPGFDWVDVQRVRLAISNLPWGEPVIDRPGRVHQLLRLLTRAAFARWASADLARRRSVEPPACPHVGRSVSRGDAAGNP